MYCFDRRALPYTCFDDSSVGFIPGARVTLTMLSGGHTMRPVTPTNSIKKLPQLNIYLKIY